jgi:hypothetical protein
MSGKLKSQTLHPARPPEAPGMIAEPRVNRTAGQGGFHPPRPLCSRKVSAGRNATGSDDLREWCSQVNDLPYPPLPMVTDEYGSALRQ